jgi:hypothetical protein
MELFGDLRHSAACHERRPFGRKPKPEEVQGREGDTLPFDMHHLSMSYLCHGSPGRLPFENYSFQGNE